MLKDFIVANCCLTTKYLCESFLFQTKFIQLFILIEVLISIKVNFKILFFIEILFIFI